MPVYGPRHAGASTFKLVCLYAMWLNVVSPLRIGITDRMNAPTLDSLRQEIDAIDGELHGLIGRRADVVGRIAGTKPAGGPALTFEAATAIAQRQLKCGGLPYQPVPAASAT